MIQSKSTQGIYIGQTYVLQKRLAQHNNPANKLTKYTKRQKGPWQLVHCEVYSSQTEARRREMALKSGQGRHWLKKLLACK
ncbi:MAG TPA: GIY-YIG nuclease family protein [Candidatus Brocadiia bacterium]